MKSDENTKGRFASEMVADGATKRLPVRVGASAKTKLFAVNSNIPNPKRVRRRALRDLTNGLPSFLTISEFAALLQVHPRTISRDIADGLLIANEIRGTLRISRRDALAYLRKTRRNVGHSQRPRAPRKRIQSTAPPGNSETA
jgi:excisionase family DNA binding protein